MELGWKPVSSDCKYSTVWFRKTWTFIYMVMYLLTSCIFYFDGRIITHYYYHLIIFLICTFLITNDAEHIFLLSGHFYIFILWIIILSLLAVVKMVCSLEISVRNNFSQFMTCLSILLKVSFDEQKLDFNDVQFANLLSHCLFESCLRNFCI